jgi:hypothetical protein
MNGMTFVRRNGIDKSTVRCSERRSRLCAGNWPGPMDGKIRSLIPVQLRDGKMIVSACARG